jgi:uncharacterized membrane protein YphA (DoxX/SURF4 family)
MDGGRFTRGKNTVKKFFNNDRVLLVLRLILGSVVIYAGITKIRGAQAFADSIATFQVLPNQMINLLALGLPPFEMIAGVCLSVGWKRRAAAFSILILTTVFALALTQALARGLKVDCGCFGSGQPSVWKTWASLGRDLLILAVTWLIYRRACGDEQLPVNS